MTRYDPIALFPGCDIRESKVFGIMVTINAAAQTRLIVDGNSSTINITIPWPLIEAAMKRHKEESK